MNNEEENDIDNIIGIKVNVNSLLNLLYMGGVFNGLKYIFIFSFLISFSVVPLLL